MGYLVLTRNEGESLTLTIQPGAAGEDLIRHLARDGITICIAQIKGGSQVRVGIEAPAEINIIRTELLSD